MVNGPFRGDDPSPHVVEVQLLSIPLKGAIEVTVLGPWRSCITHWYRGKSWYCPGGEHCDRTVHKCPPIWKAFAPVEVFHRQPQPWWVPHVLEVSERLAICMGDANHRGEVWKLYRRPGRRDRHECWGDLVRNRGAEDLRTDIEVTRVVRRLGRAIEIEWDVPMPFEAPQVLAARQADFTVPQTMVNPASEQKKPEVTEPRKSLKELFREQGAAAANGNGHNGKAGK
jgi:hypothetical protein